MMVEQGSMDLSPTVQASLASRQYITTVNEAVDGGERGGRGEGVEGGEGEEGGRERERDRGRGERGREGGG